MKFLLFFAYTFVVHSSLLNDSTDPFAEMNLFIYVPDIGSLEEALDVYEKAFSEDEPIPYRTASAILEKNFTAALRNARILTMDALAFLDLISKPWKTEEIEVFYAVGSWLGAHPNTTDEIAALVKRKINLVAINPDQLREIVYPSEVISKEKVVEALTIKAWRMDDAKYERFSNQFAKDNVLGDTDSVRDVSMGSCDYDFFHYYHGGRCRFDAANKTILFRSTMGYTINRMEVAYESSGEGTVEVQVSSDEKKWETVGILTGPSTTKYINFRSPLSVRYYKLITDVSNSSAIEIRYIRANYDPIC